MRIVKKQVLSIVFIVIFGFIVVFASLPVQADQSLIDTQIGLNTIGQSAYGDDVPTDIRITTARIINVVLGFLGIIFVVLMIVAGFQYMTSGGNEEKTKKALELIRNAVIGLVIVLVSWLITRYTIQLLSRTVNGAVDYQTYFPN